MLDGIRVAVGVVMRWLMTMLVVGSIVLSGYSRTTTVSKSQVSIIVETLMYDPGVDDAVMDYRVDPLGNVFESHAPDIAIPALADPST